MAASFSVAQAKSAWAKNKKDTIFCVWALVVIFLLPQLRFGGGHESYSAVTEVRQRSRRHCRETCLTLCSYSTNRADCV